MAHASIASVTATYPGHPESAGSVGNALDVRKVRKEVALIEEDGGVATIYVNGVRMESLAHYEQTVEQHVKENP